MNEEQPWGQSPTQKLAQDIKIALDDLCMQCDNGFHARALHTDKGCTAPGCSCKATMMEPRTEVIK